MDPIIYSAPAIVNRVLEYNPFRDIDFQSLNLCLLGLELHMTAFQAYRTKQLKVNRSLIKELDSNLQADPSSRNHVPFNENSKFHSLSNSSEGKPTTLLETEEKRNLFDVLKDSCNPQDSEASDIDVGSDIEKSDTSTNGPPSKKIKLEEELKKEEEEEEDETDVNKGIRLLDQYMDCQPTEFSLVSSATIFRIYVSSFGIQYAFFPLT